MRSRRNVTLQPMPISSRSLKFAMDFLDCVITAFCPAISDKIFSSRIDLLAIGHGFANAHVEDDLLDPRHRHGVGIPEPFHQSRFDVAVVNCL